ELVRACDQVSADVMLVPRLFELSGLCPARFDRAWDIPLVRLPRPVQRRPTWRLKRVVDVVVASVALVLTAPVMALCALGVLLESGPGVLFRQQRVGCDGREFTMVKFRTLRPATDEEPQTLWNVDDDPRLGPVGRFLRRSSLDELPQLWNVLR